MDNPSAFPRPATILPGGDVKNWGEEGMTLRDYFAASAITGILSGHFPVSAIPKGAALAYQVADAMLVARTKAGGPTSNGD